MNLRMLSARDQWSNPDGTPGSSFFRLIASMVNGLTTHTEQAVIPGSSPFVFTVPQSDGPGAVIVNGGSVSQIEYSRSGTYYTTGQTSGMFPVSGGDSIRVTYSVAPTITYAP